MSATWWWVRHGPTHEKAFVGWRDVAADLSDHAAIARLAAYLPKDAVVVSSDLTRCVTTADAIAGTRARLPHKPSLREFNFGAWDGLTFDQVAARDPVLSRLYWDAPGDTAPPDGESWNAAAARIAPEVDALNAAHAGGHIIAVAHFGVILTQIARARRQSPGEAIAQRIEPLSVTRINYANAQADPVNLQP